MTTISFTTPRGAKIELTQDGSRLSVSINGASATPAGDWLVGPSRDLLPVSFNGKDMAIQVPASQKAEIAKLLEARSKAAYDERQAVLSDEDKAYIAREKFHDDMRRRMYSANSDH